MKNKCNFMQIIFSATTAPDKVLRTYIKLYEYFLIFFILGLILFRMKE